MYMFFHTYIRYVCPITGVLVERIVYAGYIRIHIRDTNTVTQSPTPTHIHHTQTLTDTDTVSIAHPW